LKARGDFGVQDVGRNDDGCPDTDGDFVELSEAAALLFHVPDAVEAHRDDGELQVLREETDALLKRHHFWCGAVVDYTFGEN